MVLDIGLPKLNGWEAFMKIRAEQPDVNLMPLLVEAVEAYATVGEITSALRHVWGEYRQPVVF